MSTVLLHVRQWHRPLMIMVGAMAALVVAAGIGLIVDQRELLDESIWAKPFKFGISFVIYGASLAWMLPKLRKAKRTMWTLGTVFAVTGIVDVGFIAVQAARGTFSHFNTATDTFNQVGQQVFQTGVIGLFGASVVIAIMLLFQRVGDAAFTWALRAGVALAAAGMAAAFYLVGAGTDGTPREVTDANGDTIPLSGQHGIGVADGGGMPITNWSTVGGDLRVPHFIGLHALQVFGIAVIVMSALGIRLAWLRHERTRAQLVGVVIVAYTGLFAITTWQAGRGQSLIHPDAATWTAVAAVGLTSVAMLALAVARAKARHRRLPEAEPTEPIADLVSH